MFVYFSFKPAVTAHARSIAARKAATDERERGGGGEREGGREGG